MQRTLSPLGLTLSLLLFGGCADPADFADTGTADASSSSDFFCSLPDVEECDRYLDHDAGTDEGASADAGTPGVSGDAGAWGDAASGDASVADNDAGTDGADGGMTSLDNPCVDRCGSTPPSAPTCGDGYLAEVECREAYLGYCAWHFLCGDT